MEIAAENFGKLPFSESQWLMYFGAKDPEPNQSGCLGMKLARDWVIKDGAKMKVFIEDLSGDHGGIHMNPSNVEALFAKFALRNRYQDADTVFDLAVKQFPNLLTPHASSALGFGYYYRCYLRKGICVGAKNVDPHLFQDRIIKPVGTTQDF